MTAATDGATSTADGFWPYISMWEKSMLLELQQEQWRSHGIYVTNTCFALGEKSTPVSQHSV